MTSIYRSTFAIPSKTNTLDVTGSVHVSSTEETLKHVCALAAEIWPAMDLRRLQSAFRIFENMTSGRDSRFLALDTPYHDVQHSMDVTLCTVRLLAGHEANAPLHERLGANRALVGLLCALFHDAGYLRRKTEKNVPSGAHFTHFHVTRSAGIITSLFEDLHLKQYATLAANLVHFTGYERSLDIVRPADHRNLLVGRLLGSADLLAQMADRCYLEKVRDRLFDEFVIAGIAGPAAGPGKCQTPKGLLESTPGFVEATFTKRLDGAFEKAYRRVSPIFVSPYLDSIQRQMAHLERVIAADDWSLLRRIPPTSQAAIASRQRPSNIVPFPSRPRSAAAMQRRSD